MKMLVIQTGDATQGANHLGNFSDWFQNAVPDKPMVTVHVHRGETLPDVSWAKDQCSHVIITGSAAMVTEQKQWMLKTQRWLARSIEALPTLGVCFGHQLLADLLGGQVSYNAQGRNMGADKCQLTQEGINDLLFQGFDQNTFNTWVSHLQSVDRLPTSCERMASCKKDENHAFRYKNHVYGLQFHPEWNQSIMQGYIKDRKSSLIKEGFDVKNMLGGGLFDGHAIIQQFIKNTWL